MVSQFLTRKFKKKEPIEQFLLPYWQTNINLERKKNRKAIKTEKIGEIFVRALRKRNQEVSPATESDESEQQPPEVNFQPMAALGNESAGWVELADWSGDR